MHKITPPLSLSFQGIIPLFNAIFLLCYIFFIHMQTYNKIDPAILPLALIIVVAN